jgi:hypothetical protein
MVEEYVCMYVCMQGVSQDSSRPSTSTSEMYLFEE